jgi:hypothetical protein
LTHTKRTRISSFSTCDPQDKKYVVTWITMNYYSSI